MRYVHWYNILLGLKEWHRYAVSILSGVGLILLWLILLYLPLHKQIMTMRMQVHQREQDLATCVKEQELCKNLKKQVDQLQHEYNVDGMLGEHSVQDTIALVIKQLESSQLHVTSIKKGAAKQKDWYGSIPVIIQAQGTLPSIHNFFDVLQRNDLLVQCCDVLIQHAKDDQYTIHGTLKFFIPQKNS